MKAAVLFLAFAAAVSLQGGAANLFGLGLSGFNVITLPQVKTVSVPLTTQPEVSVTSLPVTSVPLASGLSLSGTTAYVKSTPAVNSTQCLTTALSLFSGCQPFLQTLVNNNGTLNKITILQLLLVAQNTTSDSQCFTATLNFLNQGCVCDQATSSTLQALPTTTVPQLVKTFASLLSQLLCPNGLVSSPPPPAVATVAAPTTSTAASTSGATTLSSGPATSIASALTG